MSKAKDPKAAPKLKDAPSKAKDATVKAKEAEAKSKEADPKAKDAPTSQLGNKEDLLRSPRHSVGSLSFALLVFCLHVNFLDCGSFAVVPGVLFLYLMKRLQALQYLLLIDRNHCFALY